MAKEIYPFAYIVQGDFAGMYVYYQDYDDSYFVRSESVYKNGMFSSGLWYNANYQYKFRDIIGYEDIGSATRNADAASVIKGGLMLGVVGAMAASAAGTGTTHDTVMYFKDGKKCVFRFLNSHVHQNHITSFHQLNIKPGNPTIASTSAIQTPNRTKKVTSGNVEKREKVQPAPLVNPSAPEEEISIYETEIDENSRYDLYAMSLLEDFSGLVEIDDEFATAAIQFMRTYADTPVMIDKQLADPSLGKLILLRVDISGTEVIRIMQKGAEDDRLSFFGDLGAKQRPQTQTAIKQQSKTNTLNYEELKQLKELLDMGIISQEEFDAKKKQLLGL